MSELAARYCRHAIGEARQINMLTEKMELEAQRDLELYGQQQGRADVEVPKDCA